MKSQTKVEFECFFLLRKTFCKRFQLHISVSLLDTNRLNLRRQNVYCYQVRNVAAKAFSAIISYFNFIVVYYDIVIVFYWCHTHSIYCILGKTTNFRKVPLLLYFSAQSKPSSQHKRTLNTQEERVQFVPNVSLY